MPVPRIKAKSPLTDWQKDGLRGWIERAEGPEGHEVYPEYRIPAAINQPLGEPVRESFKMQFRVFVLQKWYSIRGEQKRYWYAAIEK